MTSNLYKSKKGAAAFYVVIFTTLLLSVITMSFIRIMLSEATKSTNDDLSKSAYDSALAGLEDAKIALVKYHRCLDEGYKANKNAAIGSCEYTIWVMQNGDCDTVAMALGRNGTTDKNKKSEVIVKEGGYTRSNKNSEDMEQAYTCVKISEEVPDYRSQVNSSDRVRIIPIRTEDVASIAAIKFQWFKSRGHEGYTINKHNVSAGTSALFNSSQQSDSRYVPPVVLDFYQTNEQFKIGELSVNNGTVGTDRMSLFLKPASGGGIAHIKSSDILSQYSHKADNALAEVNCDNEGFRCQSIIELPAPFRGGSRGQTTALLRVELPYGDVDTDFSITLCKDKDCKETTKFVGVQAQVDSTGRANDLYRRVDARVELIDTSFPYPEFAIQLDGGNEESISKNFWVTKNCWSSNPAEDEDRGSLETKDKNDIELNEQCDNAGELD